MSRETMEWLNNNTLIGFTDKRGMAWHYQEAMQGDEPNHYPGAIPVEDVRRRLFAWKAESEPIFVKRGDAFVAIPRRQAISATDDGTVLGIFKDGYQPHQYDQWLLTNVANLIGDGELGIGSAGLLANRARAWVSIEVPENVRTPEGVEFRPNLLAATSFDGSLATNYIRAVTNVVCDNTLDAGLGEKGQVFRVKHTRNSDLRVKDAREALAIVHDMSDEFSEEVRRLTAWEVPTPIFAQHLDLMVPTKDATGAPLRGRSATIAEKKRGHIKQLYAHDDRVAPWAGTAWGVLQAYNTYAHHFQTVRGTSRVQRNRDNAITGRQAREDVATLAALASLTA